MEGYCTGFKPQGLWWDFLLLLLQQHVDVIPGIGKYAYVNERRKNMLILLGLSIRENKKHLELFLFF